MKPSRREKDAAEEPLDIDRGCVKKTQSLFFTTDEEFPLSCFHGLSIIEIENKDFQQDEWQCQAVCGKIS